MKTQVLVLSKAFQEFLSKHITELKEGEDRGYTLDLAHRKLRITNYPNPFCVEASGYFQISITREKLRRTINILKELEEQPIVLGFDDTGYISIQAEI